MGLFIGKFWLIESAYLLMEQSFCQVGDRAAQLGYLRLQIWQVFKLLNQGSTGRGWASPLARVDCWQLTFPTLPTMCQLQEAKCRHYDVCIQAVLWLLTKLTEHSTFYFWLLIIDFHGYHVPASGYTKMDHDVCARDMVWKEGYILFYFSWAYHLLSLVYHYHSASYHPFS